MAPRSSRACCCRAQMPPRLGQGAMATKTRLLLLPRVRTSRLVSAITPTAGGACVHRARGRQILLKREQ